MRILAAGLLIVALAGCGNDGASRCDVVERAAKDQTEKVAAIRSTTLSPPGPGSGFSSANERAELERTEARQALTAEDGRETRVLLQIVVGDPTCFDPATVATARERLGGG